MKKEESIKTFEELVAEEYGNKSQGGMAVEPSLPSLLSNKRPSAKEGTTLALDLEGVIDVLDDGEKLVYLAADGKTVESILYQGVTYKTPPKSSCPYLFPEKDKVLVHIKNWDEKQTKKLYEDLRQYHKAISELPDEDLYDLLTLWVFHTWIIEKSNFTPFLYFYAVKERGKSRTVKGLIYVARRGIFTETIRQPDILRWGNDHRAVLGFDAKDFPKKIERAGCDDLILTRFERGATASRTLWPERGAFKDTKNFKLFGATAIATNRPVDDILESRTIPIGMKPTDKRYSNPVLPEDALELKTRLAAFRAHNYLKALVPAEPKTQGRLGDITLPLYQIVLTFFPEKGPLFLRLLKKIQAQKREEVIDTLEAQILETIIGIKLQVQEGKLAVETITSNLNERHGRKDNFAIRSETVGRILKGLGFDKTRITGGKSGIFYDENLIKKLSTQYGVDEGSEDSEGSESEPGTSITDNEDTVSQAEKIFGAKAE